MVVTCRHPRWRRAKPLFKVPHHFNDRLVHWKGPTKDSQSRPLRQLACFWAHKTRRHRTSEIHESDQATSPAQVSDFLPDANRFMPPKPSGSISETLFLGSDSAYEKSISDAVLCLAVALFLGGDSACGSLNLCSVFSREPDRKIARKLAKNPVFRFAKDCSFFATVSEDDRCRFLNLRLRSLFDLTLPIHETFGDDGSTSGASDFPTDPDLFGNKRAFPGLQTRRFLAST